MTCYMFDKVKHNRLTALIRLKTRENTFISFHLLHCRCSPFDHEDSNVNAKSLEVHGREGFSASKKAKMDKEEMTLKQGK